MLTNRERPYVDARRMRVCSAIAVDFDTGRVDRNGKGIWETRTFREDEEDAARAFLADKQKLALAALSKRMVSVEGRWFRAEWVGDSGRVLCESEGDV